jgi:hypothetical protein
MNAKPTDGKLIATGRIHVTSYDSQPYDETDGFAMAIAKVAEQFSGGLVGTGSARFILATESVGGAVRFTGIDKFTGKLDGNSGSFLFENSGTLKSGELQSTWQIVPGSGTGALKGLRGEGGSNSKGYRLSYRFE